MNRIKPLALRYYAKLIEYRRHFHQHPELSGQEKETASYICKILDSLNIPYQANYSGYGIVALLKGAKKGEKTVALRADMDALPIQEENNTPYCSRNSGIMHACGHDLHLTCLLGALHILNDLRNEFGGYVKAIFQPSEEEFDGGAQFMIADGVLENPKVDVIYGLHATPGMETGSIGVRLGAMMASTDELHLHITGKGGHAALPAEVVNPIDIGMETISKIKKFVEYNNPDIIPTVINFGRFMAEGGTNIIPERAYIAGTLRTFDESWRTAILQKLKEIAENTAHQYGGKILPEIKNGYPVLCNNPEATENFIKSATLYIGIENIVEIPPRMTAEDFAYFTQKIPGTFFRLGTSNSKKGITSNLHRPDFDVDEKSIEIGSGLLAWITLQELTTNQKIRYENGSY